jgi:hypothetical protein
MEKCRKLSCSPTEVGSMINSEGRKLAARNYISSMPRDIPYLRCLQVANPQNEGDQNIVPKIALKLKKGFKEEFKHVDLFHAKNQKTKTVCVMTFPLSILEIEMSALGHERFCN